MTGRALVTGGTAGLGEAFAQALAGQGYDVVSLDRSRTERENGVSHVNCDLADREALDRALPGIVEAGPYDIVIFNAGISATGRFERIPADVHRRVLRVNTEAPMVLCAALAGMGALRRGGSLVFVSSLSHRTGYPGAASYAASKDALAIYAKSIRKPFRRDLGVTVCCAFPGPLATAHAARHSPAKVDAERRMPAQVAARLILEGAAKGKAVIVPGFGAKASALAGRLFPSLTARMMRSIIYDKLDGDVW